MLSKLDGNIEANEISCEDLLSEQRAWGTLRSLLVTQGKKASSASR